MEDNLEELTNFNDLSEAEKEEERKDLEELKEKVDKVVPKAKDTANSLRVAADKLDQFWMDSKIAQASGTSATIVGELLTIGGGIATIFTFGAAPPLLHTGIGIGVAGAGVKIGTSIVEASINSSEIQTAEKNLQETFDDINDVHNIIQKWVGYKEKARLLYMCYLAVYILELSEPVIKFLQKSILPLIGHPPIIVEVAGRVNMNVAQAVAQGVAQGARQAGAQGERQAGAQGARQ